MLFALVVVAGVVLLTVVFNNRRRPSRWDGAGSGWDGGQHREWLGVGVRQSLGW